MARTISPDYDKRRDTIVANAAKLYAKSGFLGASISDLAKACKFSKSLVYHYFPSKEDILYAVMAEHLDDLVDVVETVDAQAQPPKVLLRLVTARFMAKYVEAAASQKVLLNELDNLPQERRREVRKKQQRIVDKLQEWIMAIRPDLRDHPDLHRPISMIYFGMVNWTHTWFDKKGPVAADRFADLVVDILLKGIDGLSPEAYSTAREGLTA